MSLKANASIEGFLRTLRCIDSGKKRKRKIIERFTKYVEESENLEPQKWNFDTAIKVVYDENIFFLPLNRKKITDYLSHINCSVTPRVYNEILGTLNQFCEYLVDSKILRHNPIAGEERKKVIIRDMTNYRISLEEVAELIVSSYEYNEHKIRNLSLILMLLTTSTRIGEATALTESDIDWEREKINAFGKTGHRQRFLPPGLKETLQKLVTDPLRAKALQGIEEKYILYSDNGGQLTTEKANELIKAFARKAGITTDITSYWLRRTFAKILLDNGFDMKIIQAIFVHDKLRSTEFYVHEDRYEKIANAVEDSPLVLLIRDSLRKHLKSINPTCGNNSIWS
jgi:integrase/recombinase XerD